MSKRLSLLDINLVFASCIPVALCDTPTPILFIASCVSLVTSCIEDCTPLLSSPVSVVCVGVVTASSLTTISSLIAVLLLSVIFCGSFCIGMAVVLWVTTLSCWLVLFSLNCSVSLSLFSSAWFSTYSNCFTANSKSLLPSRLLFPVSTLLLNSSAIFSVLLKNSRLGYWGLFFATSIKLLT